MTALSGSFGFGALWSLVQADGTWSPQHLLGVEFLGHCGVQFRLTGVGSPLDPCGFGFGAFWGSVHADEIWSPPYLLGVEPGRLWQSKRSSDNKGLKEQAEPYRTQK